MVTLPPSAVFLHQQRQIHHGDTETQRKTLIAADCYSSSVCWTAKLIFFGENCASDFLSEFLRVSVPPWFNFPFRFLPFTFDMELS